MITYRIFLDTRISAEKKPVKIRIRNNMQKAEMSLQLSMSVEQFEDVQRARPRAENLRLKSMIDFFKSRMEDLRLDLISTGRGTLPVAEIRRLAESALLGIEEQPQGFGSFFESFASKRANAGYRASFEYTLKKLREKNPNVDDMPFDDVSLKWLYDLDDWLTSQGASKNTRNIHFKNIRTVINRAIDEELTNNYPFRRFHIRAEETRKRALTVEQLRMLFDYPVEDYQRVYLDMFKLIFMLIGINCADLHALRMITSEGRIEYRRAKTKRLYSIKVEPEAMEIIEKYRGEKGLLLISDRWASAKEFTKNINIVLKKIGPMERAGRGGKKEIRPLFPEISTYWARHSWATIARSLKIPKDDIALALGHGKKTVTDIYICENDAYIDEANRRVLDWVLYGRKWDCVMVRDAK